MLNIVVNHDEKLIIMNIDGVDFVFLYEQEDKSYNIHNSEFTYSRCHKSELIYRPPSFNHSLDSEFEKILHYVENNLCSKLNLNDICNLFYMSSNKIETVFKKYIKMSYYKYIQMLRVGFGISRLSNPGIRIYSIAEELGFSSPQNFAKFFYKYTGTTPLEFRDMLIKSLNMNSGL